ncbi:CPBP family intramembrane metalloprotease [Algoriphagus kandeliae]|uniref:CPBP family intramembrane metalloprotease n=1 Tax=Algoriphagus kandeliae TaxID=2562278 RepID=A0A4Y9QTW7_9BACT|nr:CPBP family intramembrane glutamic endopeptidase [Algoriphagus kandeliae]TFV96031.1 CPBP family intramembrane metalloprotease [Algoriphagus kandeliae]
MVIIKILGNLIPALFGLYAIRKWRKNHFTRTEIGQKIGFRPFSLYQLVSGLLLGAFVFTTIFLVAIKLELIEIISFSWTNGNFITAILMFSAGAIGEELIFRSFFINGLKEFTKSKIVLLLVPAIFFSLVHIMNSGSTLLSSFSAFIGGLMYGYAFIRTEKLWLPVGLHFSWNFFQSFIYGFPVSGYIKQRLFEINIKEESQLWLGGDYGPEGGLLGIVARFTVIVLIWILIKNTAGNKG